MLGISYFGSHRLHLQGLSNQGLEYDCGLHRTSKDYTEKGEA